MDTLSTQELELERLTIRVDPRIKTNLKVLAARHGMSLNDLLTRASEELLVANDMAVEA